MSESKEQERTRGATNNVSRPRVDEQEYTESEYYTDYGSRPPLHLPMFVPSYDEVRAQHFLYHLSTGECIFIDNDSADASGANRLYSCWTRPNDPYVNVRDMRLGEAEVRTVFDMHTRLSEGWMEVAEGRKFASEEDACLAIQSFFRRVRDVQRYRDKIRTVFSKVRAAKQSGEAAIILRGERRGAP